MSSKLACISFPYFSHSSLCAFQKHSSKTFGFFGTNPMRRSLVLLTTILQKFRLLSSYSFIFIFFPSASSFSIYSMHYLCVSKSFIFKNFSFCFSFFHWFAFASSSILSSLDLNNLLYLAAQTLRAYSSQIYSSLVLISFKK